MRDLYKILGIMGDILAIGRGDWRHFVRKYIFREVRRGMRRGGL